MPLFFVFAAFIALVIPHISAQACTYSAPGVYGKPVPGPFGPVEVHEVSYFASRDCITASLNKICTDPSGSKDCMAGPTRNRSPQMLKEELDAESCLWEGSCTGNSTDIADQFFGKGGTQAYLLRYNGTYPTCFNNEKSCPSEDAAMFKPVRDWMRGSDCQSTMSAYHTEVFRGMGHGYGCCEDCGLTAGKVQLYYWPEPDADESCLEEIGDYPLDFGATTERQTIRGITTKYEDVVYWGCLSTGSNGDVDTQTTASLNSKNALMGNVTTKTRIMDPYGGTAVWSRVCGSGLGHDEYLKTDISNSSIAKPSRIVTGQVVQPSSLARWQNGTIPSTIVSDSFTLSVSCGAPSCHKLTHQTVPTLPYMLISPASLQVTDVGRPSYLR